MEDRVGSSNGVGVSKRSRSLDTLYKSSIPKDSVDKSFKRKHGPGSDGDRLKQDKKSRKVGNENETVLDKSCNGTKILDSLEESKVGLDVRMCDGNGLQGVSEGLAGSMIYVPRRRRDFVGRSRFENGLVQKSADTGESVSQERLVDNLPKETGEESSAQDQLSKAEEKDSDKELKEANSTAQLENGHSNRSPVKDDQLVVKQTNSNSRKRKSSGSNRRVGKEAKSSGDASSRIPKVLREDDEENLEANAAIMLSSRFDPNCTQFPSKVPVTPESPSTSRVHPLSSGKNSVTPGSELISSKCVSDDNDDRSLRPRRKRDWKGKVRKRRHFYEISFSDVDSHWLLNKKIKVFWPLDERWYDGFVDGYDGDKNLHHVKYDDRDEEWINLQGERFKILLFATEVPGKNLRKRSNSGSKSATTKVKGNDTSSQEEKKQKGKLEDDSCMDDMESEPIIKWLARSVHRDKSSTPKAVQKRRKSEIMTSNETVTVNGDVVRDTARQYTDRSASSTPSCGSPGPSGNEYPLVYYRRRLHTAKKGTHKGPGGNNVELLHVSKSPDPDVDFLPFKDSGPLEIYCPWNDTEQFELSLSLQVVSLRNYFLMVDVDWLSRVVFLLHHGTLVTLWPRVCLEMIFLNKQYGLRYLVFEGCLMEAVQLIFRILMVVAHSNKQGVQGVDADLQLPVFSIGVQVTFIPGFQRQFACQCYSFDKVKHSQWSYLEQNVMRHCLLVKQVSTSECTYDDMEALQKVMQKRFRHGISSCFVSRRSPSVKTCPTSACYKKQSTSAFALPLAAGTPALLRNLHLEMVRELGHVAAEYLGTERYLVTDGGCDMADCTNDEPSLKSKGQNSGPTITSSGGQEARESKDLHTESQRHQLESNSEKWMSCSSSVLRHKHKTRSNVAVNSMSIQVPTSDHREDGALQSSNLALNNQGSTSSPKVTPRSVWQRGKSSLNGHLSHGWSDSKGNFLHTNLGSGPKKRRTQVSYSLPSGGSDSRNKGSLHKGLPNKRIRRSAADVSKSLEKDLESSFCDANVLVTFGDRGWREYGAQIVLEPFDNNEWKLAVKISGTTKYSHRVHQFLQPGSTNKFTHAMMWKGGKDWTLEFPDRGQWFLFKEMHEECYSRNTRAALVRNIPIPGIRMIEKDTFDGTETEFFCSAKYFRQTETDVEMALNPSRVLYDMDSDDEQYLKRIRECSDAENSGYCEITEDMFEKAMDTFEKASYVKQRDHFTLIEIQELMAGVGSLEAVKTIYEFWRTKRQRKGMPLIRHLQPPLWEKYQRELKNWELVISKANTPNSYGLPKKESPIEKPAMFAFCFKPRGLEVKHRGTKHRTQKKLSVYAQHSTTALGDYDAYNSSAGRRSGGYAGDERFLYSNHNYEQLNEVPATHSPRDLGMGYFSTGGNGYHRNHQNKFQRINGKRNTSTRWNAGYSETPCYSNGSQRLELHNNNSTDIDERKLRDAAGAARRACALAKVKRERAERLRYVADLAIQKAAAALLCAEAVKGSSLDQNCSGSDSSSEDETTYTTFVSSS
ncbi:unnamed protein product [Eruca vesicaria subsp. sativa]|uniref:Enhancer of polycomb-like protein n=1 Tax=Eruca vesicaria subsp. sativa TaxID=29727 RepID=A0ABC8JFR4_ERUVS|nr:unnamed protein product [Eruca vesicaria subsp. sativa]